MWQSRERKREREGGERERERERVEKVGRVYREEGEVCNVVESCGTVMQR